MITTGIFSFFQLVFLPGYLISRFFRVRGLIDNVLFSFGTSLIFNYLLVLILTSLHIYSRGLVLIIFVIEILILVFTQRQTLKEPVTKFISSSGIMKYPKVFWGSVVNNYVNYPKSTRIFLISLFFVSVCIATACVLFFFIAFIRQIGSTFTASDVVLSWDRWAIDWYHNILPNLTWHYPQLIPANWSLTYQFMGDTRVKWIAKSIMWLFEILILVMLINLGIKHKNSSYFWGTFLAAGLLWIYGPKGDGSIDAAVAFYSFLSIYCLLNCRDVRDPKELKKYILLGAFFSAGAAVTKQAGLYIALLYPFIAFILIRNELNLFQPSEIKRILLTIAGMYLCIIGTWYIYDSITIYMGKNVSELDMVTNLAHEHRNVLERLVHGFNLFQDGLAIPPIAGVWNVLILVLLIGASIIDRTSRALVILIIVPYTILWGILFSYDLRNLTYVLPFAGLAAGVGLSKMVYSIFYLPKIKLWFCFVIALLFLLLLPLRFDDQYLITQATEKQKSIGVPIVNESIYRYYAVNGLSGKILTDYQYLGHLPDLSNYYSFAYSNNPSFISFANQPDCKYVLLYEYWTNPEVWSYFNERSMHGEAVNLIDVPQWRFFQIKGIK